MEKEWMDKVTSLARSVRLFPHANWAGKWIPALFKKTINSKEVFMKTLNLSIIFFLSVVSVYAGGQIDISYAGFTISQPGSYIVVADLHAIADQNAITVSTSDVTIDLNGHVLYGAGTTTGSSGYGIYAGSNTHNLTVTNGVIRDFRTSGITLGGMNCQISKIKAIRNRFGIYASNDIGTLRDCIAEGNATGGILVGDGYTITGNSAYGNGQTGIEGNESCIVIGNSSYMNTGNGIQTHNTSVIKDNSSFSNGGWGIYAQWGSTVTGNSSNYNSGYGIYAATGSNVIGNTVRGNDLPGIYAETDSCIKDNEIVQNRGDGIRIDSQSQVIGNSCINNGYGAGTASGIRVVGSDNNIENNLLTDNDIGLFISGTGNFYASNRASGNTISNYSTVGAQTDGGTISVALTNVNFYTQSNLIIPSFAGFDIPFLKESREVIVRNLVW